MKKFTGKQVLDLLYIRAEQKAFIYWEKPLEQYEFFRQFIWLKTIWTKWYKMGVIDGAVIMNSIKKMELSKESLGEYECLMYHFCIEEENGNDE